MHINDLLRLKIQKDIQDELLNFYKTNDIDINITIYKKIIKKKIKNKTENINFLNSITNVKFKDYDNRCCARIWDNHYGTRCRYKQIKDFEYCKHHLNVLEKKGKLLFNRYDESRPLFNEKNNPIPWKNKSKIDILNNVLQTQWNITENIIKNNLSKQRQITP